ncbi:MAG: phosphoheptose isomerase [Acidiferrobacteraceae bacterium]|nr:phosphoheptose isomerase [Acidiferrobacteraceae bacterium]|tara:strand:+ start:50 stop:595 length:546 start_codon:yes stop_codon:yes gene_type:complete
MSLDNYFANFQRISTPSQEVINDLIRLKEILVRIKDRSAKVFIVGNGGSSAIASHVSVDFTKAAGLTCWNFSDPSLLTCFANDYGYENWVKEAINAYGDAGDALIVISSSGESKNIINACRAARDKEFASVATFTGFNSGNSVRKWGDLNFWVDSTTYNMVENTHQLWLLSIVDSIAGVES